jgi:hypothetical protein
MNLIKYIQIWMQNEYICFIDDFIVGKKMLLVVSKLWIKQLIENDIFINKNWSN